MASKRSVRRLHVTDPYNKNSTATVATFSPAAEEFTNNPNPAYDPSRHSNDMTELSVAASRKAAQKPGKASRGHQKVIPRTLFNQNGGKTVIKRP